jgi:hypothetical protein
MLSLSPEEGCALIMLMVRGFPFWSSLDRFKKNLDNLGGFMEDVTLQVTRWDVEQVSHHCKALLMRTTEQVMVILMKCSDCDLLL